VNTVVLGYSVSLIMFRNDVRACSYSMSTGPDRTLNAIMADAFATATFYLSDRGDGAYTHVDAAVEEHCATCQGSGSIGRTRRLRTIKCKACKGDGARREIFRTMWKTYDNGGRDYVTCIMNERPATIGGEP
jgi:DnaJ-class molecular chaperone